MIYLERSVENKKIIWLKETNRYMLVEIPAYDVISRLANGITPVKTAVWFSKFYGLPPAEARRFVNEIVRLIERQVVSDNRVSGTIEHNPSFALPSKFYSTRHYLIDGLIYTAEYETKHLEHQIHPKFAHLEVASNQTADHLFQVCRYQGFSILKVNGVTIGEWLPEDDHFLSGKFSMELLNRMYGRSEPEWMGVFHASAIRRGNQSILFLGDSGSGKSTGCAILMANGFHLLADDFVPVDGRTGEVFYFPAAVSVKKRAFEKLMPLYPQLASAAEFEYPEMDKTVRFLKPLSSPENHLSHYPCKALIFVKYQKNSDLIFDKMPMDIAFQLLVPDSWISPLEENASRFLDWFLKLPCFRLTYSDNTKMVAAIEKIFQNDF